MKNQRLKRKVFRQNKKKTRCFDQLRLPESCTGSETHIKGRKFSAVKMCGNQLPPRHLFEHPRNSVLPPLGLLPYGRHKSVLHHMMNRQHLSSSSPMRWLNPLESRCLFQSPNHYPPILHLSPSLKKIILLSSRSSFIICGKGPQFFYSPDDHMQVTDRNS